VTIEKFMGCRAMVIINSRIVKINSPENSRLISEFTLFPESANFSHAWYFFVACVNYSSAMYLAFNIHEFVIFTSFIYVFSAPRVLFRVKISRFASKWTRYVRKHFSRFARLRKPTPFHSAINTNKKKSRILPSDIRGNREEAAEYL